jgi:hypothetical protein
MAGVPYVDGIIPHLNYSIIFWPSQTKMIILCSISRRIFLGFLSIFLIFFIG